MQLRLAGHTFAVATRAVVVAPEGSAEQELADAVAPDRAAVDDAARAAGLTVTATDDPAVMAAAIVGGGRIIYTSNVTAARRVAGALGAVTTARADLNLPSLEARGTVRTGQTPAARNNGSHPQKHTALGGGQL